MQNTRLSTLTDRALVSLGQLASNPWRRLSLIIIGLLVGFFLSSAISSASGQAGAWDISGAALILVAGEGISRWVYGSRRLVRNGITARRTFALDFLNALKIGITYGLFLEAFKLNS